MAIDLPSAVTAYAGAYYWIACAIVVSTYLCRWWLVTSRRKIPGPVNWPLLGALPQVIINFDRRLDYLLEVSIGTKDRIWGAWFPGMGHVTAVANARAIEHVLKRSFSNYPKGQGFHERFAELLGDGIFNIDGAKWRIQRKTASHLFSQQSLREYMFPVFLEHAHRVVDHLRARPQGTCVDFQRMYFAYTLDSIGRIGFGVDIGSLNRPDHPFARAFDRAQWLTDKRFFSLAFSYLPKWAVPREWALARALRGLDAFAFQVIRARREALAGVDPDAPGGPRDVLSRFLLMRGVPMDAVDEAVEGDQEGESWDKEEEEGHTVFKGEKHGPGQARTPGDGRAPSGAGVCPFSDRFLRDVVLNFIIAGRDTTAQCLSWATFLLSQHPDAEEQVRSTGEMCDTCDAVVVTVAELVDEVDRVLGGRDPTFADLAELKYTEAVICEALRLFPSVPVDLKTVQADDVLPGGHQVNRGEWIMYMPYVMGRDPARWPEPEQFRPERWLPPNPPPSAFEWPVFNAGPRTCLGQRMALAEAKTMLSVLYTHCMPRLLPGHRVHYEVTVTLPMKHGLSMTMQWRPRASDQNASRA